MKIFHFFTISLVLGLSSLATAQDPVTGTVSGPIELVDPTSHPSAPRQLTVREQRQLIAQEKAANRRARMERNAWHGHHPLRPAATDLPFMRSNYVMPYYQFSVVPVFYR